MSRAFLAMCESNFLRCEDAIDRAKDQIAEVIHDKVAVAYCLMQIEKATEELRQLRIRLHCVMNPHASECAVRKDDMENAEIMLDDK